MKESVIVDALVPSSLYSRPATLLVDLIALIGDKHGHHEWDRLFQERLGRLDRFAATHGARRALSVDRELVVLLDSDHGVRVEWVLARGPVVDRQRRFTRRHKDLHRLWVVDEHGDERIAQVVVRHQTSVPVEKLRVLREMTVLGELDVELDVLGHDLARWLEVEVCEPLSWIGRAGDALDCGLLADDVRDVLLVESL